MINTNNLEDSIFGKRLRDLRIKVGLTQGQVILKLQNSFNIEITQASLSKYESGTHEPNLKTLKVLAEIYNVDPTEILFLEEKSPLTMINTVHVYSHIPAGTPLEAIQDILDEVSIPEWLSKKKNLFGLKVVGDSMNRVLPDGCIAVLQKTKVLENGEIGAILVNGYDATIKKFFKITDSIVLEPLSFNPDYKPIIIENGQETVVTIGKLLWYCAPRDF